MTYTINIKAKFDGKEPTRIQQLALETLITDTFLSANYDITDVKISVQGGEGK